MSGKKKKRNSENSYVRKLKNLLKTEIAVVHLASDDTKFLDEYQAVIHECNIQEQKDKDRRWDKMKAEIAELICHILKEKNWGIFFKNEPMQALPVQDNTAIYKINEVKKDELIDAVNLAMDERTSEWQKQTKQNQNQQDNELSSGTNQTFTDTEE